MNISASDLMTLQAYSLSGHRRSPMRSSTAEAEIARILAHPFPFGLSLSKPLCNGPFDKLRVNGIHYTLPIQAEPVEAPPLQRGPFDKLRVNGHSLHPPRSG